MATGRTYNKSVCFVPSTLECSQDYVNRAIKDIERYRFQIAITVIFMLVFSLCTNGTTIFVFKQSSFKKTFIAGLMQYMYAGNIAFMFINALFVTIFFLNHVDLGAGLEVVGLFLWFLWRWWSSFVTWTLSAVCFFRINIMLFPNKFNQFRQKYSNKNVVCLLVLILSFAINIDCLIRPNVQFCYFNGRRIFRTLNPRFIVYINSYIAPLLIIAISSVVILISGHRNASKPRLDYETAITGETSTTFHSMNRIILVSVGLLFVSFFPVFVYYQLYESDYEVTCNEDYDSRFIYYTFSLFALTCNNTLDSVLYFLISPIFRTVAISSLKQCYYKMLGDTAKLDTQSPL